MGTTEVQEEAPVDDPSVDDVPDPGDRPAATTAPRTIDWSGRSSGADDDADGGSDGRRGDGPRLGAGGGSGTRRLAVLAGVVSVAYVAWVVVDLVVLAVSPTAYTSMHQSLGSLGARIVLSLVGLAVLYHGLDGVRVVAVDFVPRLRARDRLLRGLVGFTLFAVWIPTSLVILWPAIRGWFAA